MWVLFTHLSSMLNQFFLFSGLLHDNRKLRYLFLETAKIHICYRPKMFPETHSVTVKQLNASTGFASWVSFLTFSSMTGHFFHFCFPIKRQPAFIYNKEAIRRILRSSPIQFPGTHSKAVNKKKGRISKILVYGPYR